MRYVMRVKVGRGDIAIPDLTDHELGYALESVSRKLPRAKSARNAEQRKSTVVAALYSSGPQGEAAQDYFEAELDFALDGPIPQHNYGPATQRWVNLSNLYTELNNELKRRNRRKMGVEEDTWPSLLDL